MRSGKFSTFDFLLSFHISLDLYQTGSILQLCDFRRNICVTKESANFKFFCCCHLIKFVHYVTFVNELTIRVVPDQSNGVKRCMISFLESGTCEQHTLMCEKKAKKANQISENENN